MKVRPYGGTIEPLHFDTMESYRNFIKNAQDIINTYGSISYADILDLVGDTLVACDNERIVGDTLVACDNERIVWHTMGSWVEVFRRGCGWAVRLELKHPQYVMPETEERGSKCPFCGHKAALEASRICNARDLFAGRCHSSPGNFFDYIRMNVSRDSWWQYTFIIMGKTGPTGKTRLCDNLNKAGFKAFEVSEHLTGMVEYPDNENHYLVDETHKTVTIILNRRV